MPADGDRVKPSGLTDQQHRAVTARGVSVALSAGAGCGKTFVLTERFLAELKPEDATARPRLGQLVAITFTERAAREMRNRIRAACNRRLVECPENQADYWLELVRDLDSARISTIHSFCGALLRSHAVEARIDPRFRVLDSPQAATLLFELTDDVLRNRLADREESALDLVTRFGLDRLRDMIARLLAVRQQIDWPTWRSETAEGLVKRWVGFWRNDTVPRILRNLSESTAARTVLELALEAPSSHPMMRERFAVLLEQLPRLVNWWKSESSSLAAAGTAACEGPKSPCRRLLNDNDLSIETDALKTIRENAIVKGVLKKHWGDEAVYERFKNAAESLRKLIERVGKQLSFNVEAARPAAQFALQSLALAADVAKEYDEKKRELGVLDFNDLLILARDLLTDPTHGELRKRLGSQIRLLLVDEFQDTDPLQVELVKALCDNAHLRGKLFLVGDYKQSIYRFRGADPHVFRRLREEIPKEGRLPLSLNFRSQPAVLDFVNALFAEELGPDYEPLCPHRPQVSPRPGVEFLWALPLGTEVPSPQFDQQPSSSQLSTLHFPLDDDMPARERLRKREADWIARRIRNMLDAAEKGEKIVWDEEAAKAGQPSVRAARPGDFALLFRAMTNVEYYEEALRRYDIKYYVVGGRAFYAQQEIYDLLNLLRAINSPCDVASLAGVLRSPMFGLFDETLFWLSRHSKGIAAGLFDPELPEEIEGSQRRCAEYAATTLRTLRAVKDRMPVAQLIHEALRRTGYDAMLLAEFLGERKLANLHKLIEQARSFDLAGIFALSDFITQLAEFVVRQPDEPLAATHPESENVVKLMSIHQSKGLEFPVVIVPDIGRPRRKMGPPVAFTPQLGPMLKDENAATGYDLFMAAENDEEMAEHSRLLYVATTRAADYLILSAGVEDLDKPTGPWMELLAKRFNLTKGTMSRGGEEERGRGGNSTTDSQSPSLPLSHSPLSLVRVTTSEPPIQIKPVDPHRRRDLMKTVEKAQQMAADGQGKRPQYLAPVACDPGARRQYSFSRLTGKLHAKTSGIDAGSLEAESPAEPPLDARGLGTLVHAVLAEIDFVRPGDVEELVRRLAPQHLARSERDCPNFRGHRRAAMVDENGTVPFVACEMLRGFLVSPRAEQLASAKEVHAEIEFLLAWPPGDRQPGGRFLQGFIDCLFLDAAGQWRLIDYKTNRGVTAETLAEKAAPYEMQMLVYALAAETILKTPPVELALCFLQPGLEYRYAWDEPARQHVVELVNAALP